MREHKWYLIPVYYLLITSELAREGILHSGSYYFADHIYRNKPHGRFIIGYLLDAILLRFPSAQSLRFRYLSVKKELLGSIAQLKNTSNHLSILAIPSGLGRELFEVAEEVDADLLNQVNLFGLDGDADLIDHLKNRCAQNSIPITFYCGDGLDRSSYQNKHDIIFSTGFTEFLDDTQVIIFFKIVFDFLSPNGKFITSSLMPHPFSDYLLRNIAELHTQYRSGDKLIELLKSSGFVNITTCKDSTGLQTVAVAKK